MVQILLDLILIYSLKTSNFFKVCFKDLWKSPWGITHILMKICTLIKTHCVLAQWTGVLIEVAQ